MESSPVSEIIGSGEYSMAIFGYAVFAYVLIALLSYFLGCFNGALVISKRFYRDDVRSHGSGNAGLTNFYRTYGAKYALFVIGCDMGKAALSVGVSAVVSHLFQMDPITARYWSGVWCVVGHVFPITAKFKGGKGILCGGTLLLLIDWRIALVSWGLFLVLWFVTRYVSLGSIAAAVAFPITTYLFYWNDGGGFWGNIKLPFSLLIAFLILWAHRENIKRLLNGTENRFHFHIDAPKTEEKQ